jgi:hypothetical protein
MMNNQEILDNAPEGATHWDCHEYMRHTHDGNWDYWYAPDWEETKPEEETRLLADIKRIVELEKDLNIAKSIIIKTANNIIEADNCEQASDEMNECWDCLKDFALSATGRCDT